jgi:hypothetical protein
MKLHQTMKAGKPEANTVTEQIKQAAWQLSQFCTLQLHCASSGTKQL